MLATPCDGVIQPFSKVEVEFIFQPALPPPIVTGFTSTLAHEEVRSTPRARPRAHPRLVGRLAGF